MCVLFGVVCVAAENERRIVNKHRRPSSSFHWLVQLWRPTRTFEYYCVAHAKMVLCGAWENGFWRQCRSWSVNWGGRDICWCVHELHASLLFCVVPPLLLSLQSQCYDICESTRGLILLFYSLLGRTARWPLASSYLFVFLRLFVYFSAFRTNAAPRGETTLTKWCVEM